MPTKTRPQDPPLNLNFACGANIWPGFVNSDVNGWPGSVYVDLEQRPLPYKTNSADLVMHSHGLLMTTDGSTPSHPDVPAIMREFFRILKPGGWLRIDDNPYRFFVEAENLPFEGAGFPPEQRIRRDRFHLILSAAGFRNITETDPETTLIPVGPGTREAIIGNHGTHKSFAIEAQK